MSQKRKSKPASRTGWEEIIAEITGMKEFSNYNMARVE